MKVVIVEWIDVHKTMSDDEFDEHRPIDSYLTPIRTIGWLYHENDKTLMLVQEFFADDGRPHDYVVIPKSLIVKIVMVSYDE